MLGKSNINFNISFGVKDEIHKIYRNHRNGKSEFLSFLICLILI